jgi:tRNA threonylcarbamoyladenosine biosynthesis protein TsaE
MTQRVLDSENDTKQVAEEIALRLKPGDWVFLSGDLGAGKTTLVRYLLQALGHLGAVKSPTYALVETYALDALTLYHLDLYRLDSPQALEFLGVLDADPAQSLFCVEWPEKAHDALPKPRLEIRLKLDKMERQLELIWH